MLVRYEPFSRFERFADEMWRRLAPGGTMAMDVTRRSGGVEICIDLPGVRPEDIELSVERNLLTVRAERRPREVGGEQVTQERPVGTIVREVLLGDALDTEGISASYEHGVLVINVPTRSDATSRRIEVRAGAPATAIETTSREGADPGPNGGEGANS